MNALSLSREYFNGIALPKLKAEFPERMDGIAAGLCGNGSECFGYDDEISRDHDWGVDFFIWLSGSARNVIEEISKFKERMFIYNPPPYTRKKSVYGADVGVMSVDDFYFTLIGRKDAPETLREWIAIPEENLAIATNGEVFYDGAGEFLTVRKQLLRYIPEDLRRKRLSAKCMLMAQTGQYNLSRIYKRNDMAALNVTVSKFIESAAAAVFLLNKRYKPYYKWLFRALKELPIIGSDIAGRIDRLVCLSFFDRGYPETAGEIVEDICSLIAAQLRNQGLCTSSDSFLTAQGEEIREGITDARIRSLPAQYEI